MNKVQKVDFVENFSNGLNSNSFIVMMHYGKLRFDGITQFRRELITVDASLSFVKNTLASLALCDSDLSKDDVVELQKLLVGPTCFVLGKDPILTSKMIAKFSKNFDGVKIVGGVLDGKICSVAELQMFANLPTMDVARAQIIGLLKAVGSKIARILTMKSSS